MRPLTAADVHTAFPHINARPDVLERFFLEGHHAPRFSLKQRVYYGMVRPVLPLPLRRLLQKAVGSTVEHRADFIDDTLLRIVQGDAAVPPNMFGPERASATVLTHDVEEQEGFDFIPTVLELEQKHGLRSSWNIVPHKYRIDEGILRAIGEAGGEVGIHGWNHDGRLYISERMFRKRVPRINAAIRRLGAVGFRSPMVHRNLAWLQELEVDYDASCFDHDPFQQFPGGTGSIWPYSVGRFVELPYTLPQDHTLFHSLHLRGADAWIRKADWLHRNHGMILVLTHPDYLLADENLAYYDALLRHLASLDTTWHCLPREITSWFRITHPRTTSP